MILFGVHNLNETASISQEKKLQGEFGSRFLIGGCISVKNVLDDFGIEKPKMIQYLLGKAVFLLHYYMMRFILTKQVI